MVGHAGRRVGRLRGTAAVVAMALVAAVVPLGTVLAPPALADTASTITGTVTESTSGAPISGVEVNAYGGIFAALYGSATTAVDGTYTLTLPVGISGSFWVRFRDTAGLHATIWYGASPTMVGSTQVTVPPNGTASASIALTPSATVEGHVTDTGSAPAAGLQVFLLDPVWGAVRTTATTDAAGAYALPAVPGTWRIRLHDPSGRFPDWYSGGVSTWPASSTITVGPGTTTIDVQLALNPHLHGTVTGPGATPAAGIDVEALAADGSTVGTSTTAADGTYRLDAPAGPTRLRFIDPTQALAPRYFGPADAFEDATVIDTTTGSDHLADAELVAAGSLSGRVTVGSFGPGAPTAVVLGIDDARVELLSAAAVASDGTWTMHGLPPGPTKVLVLDTRLGQGLEAAYRPVFADGHDLLAEGLAAFTDATTFSVSSSSTTPTGTIPVVGYHCEPTVAVPGADLRTTFGAGLGVPVNLDGCDLHGANLAGTTLTGSLRYADLRDADLSGAILGTSAMPPGGGVPTITAGDLTGAKITGANLHHAWAFNTQLLTTNPDWTGADLRADTHKPSGIVGGIESWPVFWGGTGPSLLVSPAPLTTASSVPYSGAPLVLDGAVMEHVLFGSMPGITITGLTCSSCLFGTYDLAQGAAVNADLHGASFPGLACNGCTFVHADLRNADLAGGSCTGCDLSSADLRGAHLGGLALTGATLAGADLRTAVGVTATQLIATNGHWKAADLSGLGLDFTGATLPANADLTSAKLWGNTFAGANLFGATARFADLHGVDLHGANLSFADLSYANLAGANLRGATVTGAVFTGANLTGADTGGWVTSTNLSGLDLRGTDFSNKDLTGFTFVGSDLRGARFDHATLVNADLSGANAAGASFHYATWTGADVTGTDLTGALLSGGAFGSVTGFTHGQLLSASTYWAGIDLTGTGFSFSGFDFRSPGYVLDGSKLSGLDLSGATIPSNAGAVTWTGANLTGLHAAGTTFNHANLAGANLTGADLSDSTFLNGTDLAGADLTGATITGANLRGSAGTTFAQLSATNRNWAGVGVPPISFQSADLRASSGWNLAGADFYGINLLGANLQGTNLTGASFLQANLLWTTLVNANLTNADLTSADVRNSLLGGANLTGAKITGARLSGVWSLTKAQVLSTNHNWANTLLDAVSLDLSGTDFTTGGFTLTGVSFRKVKLDGANLSGRNLTGVSLTQANLTSATFAGATGSPTGGSTAVYGTTTCPDSVVTNGGAVTTCVGHGFGA